jgi:hypothetical protein
MLPPLAECAARPAMSCDTVQQTNLLSQSMQGAGIR